MSERPDEEPVLRAEGLTKYYDTASGFVDSLLNRSQLVKAVDDVDLELYEGETLGVVGESGCGKTTLGRAMLRLVEPTDGSIYYRGEDLTEMSSKELRTMRTDIQYIFQDPFSSLNPRLTVGDIIGEPLDIHGIADGEERDERIYELLDTVGLNPSHSHRYPHEFSGGQRQRIGIARALAVDPEIIVCDEPVSALDVSVQAQILNLLEELQEEFGLSYIFIAHDLSVVEHISDRVAVMYLGEIAEIGSTEEVYAPPNHPYAEALLSAIPEPDPLWEGEQIFLSGSVPSPINPPSGCRFHTRCPKVIQPDEFDVEQSVWRSLMDFKQRLRSASELESVAKTDDETAVEAGDLESVSRDVLGDLIRKEFGLPDRLADTDAEATISDAIDQLHAGEFDQAKSLVEDGYQSPCESIEPELLDAGSTHQISCHLFDPRYEDGTLGLDETDPGDAIADD